MTREMQIVIRLVVLIVGIALVGLGISLTISAGLGVNPWTVFHLGITNLTGLSVGRVTQLAGLVFVAIGYLSLRQKPGIGTLVNMVLVGAFVDFFLSGGLIPAVAGFWNQLSLLIVGILLNGIGTGMYISAHLGAGPRDGIMLGLARWSKWKVGRVRSMMEATVLVIGFFLGGPVGLGTILGVLVGPIVQWSLFSLEKLWEVLQINNETQSVRAR